MFLKGTLGLGCASRFRRALEAFGGTWHRGCLQNRQRRCRTACIAARPGRPPGTGGSVPALRAQPDHRQPDGQIGWFRSVRQAPPWYGGDRSAGCFSLLPCWIWARTRTGCTERKLRISLHRIPDRWRQSIGNSIRSIHSHGSAKSSKPKKEYRRPLFRWNGSNRPDCRADRRTQCWIGHSRRRCCLLPHLLHVRTAGTDR